MLERYSAPVSHPDPPTRADLPRLLFILGAEWSIMFLGDPLRGGALSHSAIGTIHHANAEGEGGARARDRLRCYYPLVKNSKKVCR